MQHDEDLTLTPFDFPDTDDPANINKPRFDVRVAMIEAAHEHAAILRFVARIADEELRASDDTSVPRHVVKFGPGRGRRVSESTVTVLVGKLVSEADEWDRRGREMFRQLPRRVAARLTLPERERAVVRVVAVAERR